MKAEKTAVTCGVVKHFLVIALSLIHIFINSELPDIQTGNGVGRASKAAAYALLGKVYLTMAADSDFQSERDVYKRQDLYAAFFGCKTGR